MTYYRKESRTSKESAFAQSFDGMRDAVYHTLQGKDRAVFEIAKILGKEQHSINPRLNELLADGFVKKSGKTKFNEETQRDVELWTVNVGDYASIKKNKVNKKNNIRDAIICLKQCDSYGADYGLIKRAIQLLEMK